MEELNVEHFRLIEKKDTVAQKCTEPIFLNVYGAQE
jgi:hypothetical protein